MTHWSFKGAQENFGEVLTAARQSPVMEIERGIEKQPHQNPPLAAALETWLRDNLVPFMDCVLPLPVEIAQRWGRMQVQLKRDDDDPATAATALEHGLQAVTRNVRRFHATGVVVVNPFGAA
jgi:predicted nucleic acid-binding protein